ncbi:response regulator transcription factor [Labedella endophytica]|uniref:Response regulator transcription factor n=1 Tax=Labedella endophytica TaxID=1523160 RepID=A0A3S0XQB4_9MICO|nr:LuxR C-terminal-related transcriptional regulator [Labedella endophytica]RUR03145.1 response regulator transcription factor [Labedella endophytica]
MGALPTGYRGGLSVAMFAQGHRRIGFLTLFFVRPQPCPAAIQNALARLLPWLASGVDPLRAAAAGALLVRGAFAGIAILPGRHGTDALPGLPGDTLLARDSEMLVVARAALVREQTYSSFLWPRGGRHAPEGHVRVTVLGCEDGLRSALTGMVVLSPAGHLGGLTPRELEVLGLVIDGRSNHDIAHVLVISPRTVAAHLEHILSKLRAGSRALAAVRAQRSGLYVPASPSPRG